MEILLDTNFILTCVRQKIDFASLAEGMFDEKIGWIVPQEVLDEMGQLKDRKGMKIEDKNAAELGFEVLQNIEPKIINLKGKNPNVDIKIVNYLIGKKIILATLDKGLKGRVNNKILTIKGKNSLIII
jgi:rRNA-processing protein FCF1